MLAMLHVSTHPECCVGVHGCRDICDIQNNVKQGDQVCADKQARPLLNWGEFGGYCSIESKGRTACLAVVCRQSCCQGRSAEAATTITLCHVHNVHRVCSVAARTWQPAMLACHPPCAKTEGAEMRCCNVPSTSVLYMGWPPRCESL